MITTVFVYVGMLLLTLLAIQDFRSKINRRGHVSQYYACLSLFVALNMLIYVGICALLLQMTYIQLLGGQVSETLPLDKKALPLVLAFAYFGVGSVNIPIGDKVVSFYGSMLKLFQGMYKPNNINLDPIKKEIHRLNTQSDLLREAIESFNDTGQARGWSILSDKWQELAQDRQALEGHSKSLKLVQAELSNTNPLDVGKISNWLDEKIGEITHDINNKLKFPSFESYPLGKARGTMMVS